MHGLDPAIAQHLVATARNATESVAFAFLDQAGAMIGALFIPSTRVASVEVPLRTVVMKALTLDAYQVVMAHNHPSGDPEPSSEDLTATRRIATVLSALGIRLVDHLVLTPEQAVSLRARGYL